MTDTRRAPMGPNVRRFVRSAWLLLIAQLLATLIALSATGWAAFYVADLQAERDSLRAQLDELTTAPVREDTADIAVLEPVPVEEQPLPPEVEPLPPEPAVRTAAPTTRPTQRPDTAQVRRPSPRPTAPEVRAPREPQSELPPEPARPPRRNTTYPGGLPQPGSNSEPVYIPVRPGNGPVRVPSVPQTDPGIIGRLPQNPSPNPPRTPNDPPRDRVPGTNGNF
ncbi:hypothetical protein [Parasphingopyxis marina]|uniref:Uncharacterized protein n=1 Tax=Parasphingopyxis marina TaxID=2761622 RepID=A0A842HVL3_9SPHN|nr:hypothetical protein [Parasphingopyxis marina]MBC2776945.1 hypothetical protein [Parasphingopyxis marina]